MIIFHRILQYQIYWETIKYFFELFHACKQVDEWLDIIGTMHGCKLTWKVVQTKWHAEILSSTVIGYKAVYLRNVIWEEVYYASNSSSHRLGMYLVGWQNCREEVQAVILKSVSLLQVVDTHVVGLPLWKVVAIAYQHTDSGAQMCIPLCQHSGLCGAFIGSPWDFITALTCRKDTNIQQCDESSEGKFWFLCVIKQKSS